MAQAEIPRWRAATAIFAHCAAFMGAIMLLAAAFLPIAWLTKWTTTIQVSSLDDWRGLIAVGGVGAAALPALAIWRRHPEWTAGVAVPGVVATVWSYWYAFVRLPQHVSPATVTLFDSAALGAGGKAILIAGPLLLVGALAAVIAARGAR